MLIKILIICKLKIIMSIIILKIYVT